MADQPPITAPPSGLVPRTDAGARKLIDRVDTMRNEVETVREELAGMRTSVVRYDRLITLLGAAATVIVSASWKVMNANVERLERRQAAEMATLHKRLESQEQLLMGVYQVNVEKKPAAQVAREVRESRDGGVP